MVRELRVAEWNRRNEEVCEGVQAGVGCAMEDSAVTARDVTWACECSSDKGQEGTVRNEGRAGEQRIAAAWVGREGEGAAGGEGTARASARMGAGVPARRMGAGGEGKAKGCNTHMVGMGRAAAERASGSAAGRRGWAAGGREARQRGLRKDGRRDGSGGGARSARANGGT